MLNNKYLNRIGIGILLLVALCLAGLEIMARVYQEKAGAYFRSQFSRQSDLVLQPFKADISVWRHFPKVTFSFSNLSLLDTSGTTPVQVFWVKRAEITVPLSQFRLDQLKIDQVDLDEVLYYQKIDSSGHKTGMHFRQAVAPDTTAGKLPFVIPELNIRQGRIISQNQFKNSSFSLEIQQAKLAAILKDNRLSLKGELNGKINSIKNNKLSLFRNQPFSGKVHYAYFLNQKKGILYNTYALVNQNKISIKGSHTRLATGPGAQLNFTLTGYQPLVYLFNQLLPPQTKAFLNKVKTNSRLYFVYRITGESAPRKRPRNSISFNLKDGEFYLAGNKDHLRAVQLHGEINNGPGHSLKTSRFTISHLSAKAGQGEIKLQMEVRDFTKPAFTLQGEGQLPLAELVKMVNLPISAVARGVVSGSFRFSGNVPDTLQNSKADWKGNGSVRLAQAAFRPLGLLVDCRGVNGQVRFTDKTLELQNLKGTIGGRPFNMQASIGNYFAYLFNDPGFVTAKANIYAEHLDTKWLKSNLLALEENRNLPDHLVARPVSSATGFPQPVINANISPAEKDKNVTTYRFTRAAQASRYQNGYRKNIWDNTQTQVNLRVDNVNLPGQEQIKNLSVQVNQRNHKVKLTRMHFTTTGQGKATASGGFNLIATGITMPYLNVSLQYPTLNLQTFMQDIASLKGQSKPQSAEKTAAQKSRNMATIKEKDYWLNLQVRAKKVEYLYLRGSDLTMEASMNKNRVKLSKLRLQAFGGQLNARGELRLDAPGDSIPVKLRSQVNNIDLQQLFAFAETMKLDVLSSQNIRGTADCNLVVYTHLDKTFSPSFVGTIAYAKASFQKMELIEVAPIQNALRFLRKERTGHLYFEDVTTNFLLRNSQFITPSLALNSNLTAFELSGFYTMGGSASLNMDINVLSVLFGNNKRRIERIQSDSLAARRVQKKQHLQLFREQNKYKVRLSDRIEREKSGQALQQEFRSFLRQHQIDTVFTMNQ